MLNLFTFERNEMALRPSNKTRTNLQIFITVALAISLGTLAGITQAQDRIRVETNQVLVPVLVVDEGRSRVLSRDKNFLRAGLAGDAQLEEAMVEGTVIRNLTAADFQVFEDGKKQSVQKVTYERSLYWDVRDNLGHHTEYMGAGEGKWSTSEWPQGLVANVYPPQYTVAYARPESPEGSCHQIRVKVNRSNAFVVARSEYCNIEHAALDPVKGTKLGDQLERDLAAPNHNNVDLLLLAIPLFTKTDSARVHIALDWPGELMKEKIRTKGVLGMIFKEDGSLMTRFSDFATLEGVPFSDLPGFQSDGSGEYLPENRYDGQVELPPGKYELRVALGDGKRFGRADIPLIVERYNKENLAISPVSVCKRISDVSSNSSQHAPKLPGAWKELPANYVPLVSNETEFKPTGNTRFKSGETLYIYFEIYEPLRDGAPQATVDFQMRIVDVRTRELKSDSTPISASPYLKADSAIIPIGRGIDISKLAKGAYRLDVRASDSTGMSTDWRTVTFTVE
jgi:hypothetical protein